MSANTCESASGGLAMDKNERVKMVKAMEFIARNINDEFVFESWLVDGVADGDIEYGDLSDSDDSGVIDYLDDIDFADLMDSFLHCMAKAKRHGGLCCDHVVSKEM